MGTSSKPSASVGKNQKLPSQGTGQPALNTTNTTVKRILPNASSAKAGVSGHSVNSVNANSVLGQLKLTTMLPTTQPSPQATRQNFSLTVEPFAKIGESTQSGANLSSVNSPFLTMTHASQIPHSTGTTATAGSGMMRALQ